MPTDKAGFSERMAAARAAKAAKAPPEPEAPARQEDSNERCPVTEIGTNRQCLYTVHDSSYAHVFDLQNQPALATVDAPTERLEIAPRKVNDNSWWCGRCDNAQLRDNVSHCMKCGAIPLGLTSAVPVSA